jgi:N-acetylmuramoyl-L-alanine amidase
MRRIAITALVCAAILCAASAALAQAWIKLPRTELHGREYVRLDQLAAAYKATYSRSGDEVVVTGKWSRVVFTANARQALIRGVNVYLSSPVVKSGDDLFLSVLDVRTVLQPLLLPVTEPKVQVRSICIDAGHGGRDPGNLEGRHVEKKYTLLLAEELRRQLKAAGLKATLLRGTDAYYDPNDRSDLARRQKADLLVSLHFNSVGTPSVKGVETYCMTPAQASSTNARGEGANTGAYAANHYDGHNILLAWHTQRALVNALPSPDRGVRRARFAVLRFSAMPAILVEGGYMSNPAEMQNIADPAYRKKLAKAVAEGIVAYKKAVEEP